MKKRISNSKIKSNHKHHKLVLEILIISIFLFLIVVPTIQAAYWGGYSGYYNSPMNYLQNEWVMFGIIFAIFFAIIFYSINRSFNNPAVSGVIAAGLSLLIAMTFAQRAFLYGYAGEELGSWILIIVSVVAIGFLVKFSFENFKGIGVAIALILLNLLFRNLDPVQLLPYGMISDSFMNFYSFATSDLVLVILGIIAIVMIFRKKKPAMIVFPNK